MRQISIGQCVSVKYFHDKGVAWSQTKPSIPESTQMRIHTAAQSVIRHWPHQELCRPTIRSLRMTNHSTAQCVIRNSVKWVFCTNAHKKLIWFHMKELWNKSIYFIAWRLMKGSMLMRNCSAAQSVMSNSHRYVIWRPAKESTLMRNHSAALSVARNSHRPVI